ncbi:hypothetical protein WMF31_24840 [Sorangium sp. So ce1036]|uniref:hypothetical protein n=1 Tax=Sorangium sp. So ce1036 TaxID=3133328 RepID=UPI003F073A84
MARPACGVAQRTMRTRFDQLSKALLEDTLAVGGRLVPEKEVASEVQSIDGWFVPDPGRRGALSGRGLLGRMVLDASGLLEAFHEPPDIDEVRACVHKQLTVDLQQLRATPRGVAAPRPPFPSLWIISAGRPERVLAAYQFIRLAGWPPGFWGRCEADAVGLVVVRDLPPGRDTLMLRLMGRGAVQTAAIAELMQLPEDAWERRVAVEHLVAFRFKLPQDGSHEDREYMMSTENLYETWRERFREECRKLGLDEGLKQGLDEGLKRGLDEGLKRGLNEARKQGLREVYEARFGPMPANLVAILEATDDEARLKSWNVLAAVGSAEEFAAALAAGSNNGG